MVDFGLCQILLFPRMQIFATSLENSLEEFRKILTFSYQKSSVIITIFTIHILLTVSLDIIRDIIYYLCGVAV